MADFTATHLHILVHEYARRQATIAQLRKAEAYGSAHAHPGTSAVQAELARRGRLP